MIADFLKALWAALAVWQQERAIRNNPEQVKNKLDIAKQEARDALAAAMATTKNPKSTPAQHAEALRRIRLAGS